MPHSVAAADAARLCRAPRPALTGTPRVALTRGPPAQPPQFMSPQLPLFSILAHVSFSDTERLNTSAPGALSGSTPK